ncbi:MAG: GNAT family N-acetyltransferase [Gaiellaceae bacterium]
MEPERPGEAETAARAPARGVQLSLEEIAAESERRRELVAILRELTEQAGETSAIGAMRDAVNAALPGDRIVLAWDGTALVGALAYRPSDIAGGTLVSYLGSRKHGVGRALLREAARSAAGRHEGLRAASIPTATGFYERLGFRPARAAGMLLPLFELDAEQTAAFARSGSEPPAPAADHGRRSPGA